MNMQQSLEETKSIKIEITDDELSLCNAEIEKCESVKDIKNENILADNRLEESFPVKTEFKSEDIEIPQNLATTLKYEIKSDEIDISYPTITATEYPSSNWCVRDRKKDVNSQECEKQRQKVEKVELSTGASNVIQGKDTTLNLTHFKRNLVCHMLVQDKTKEKVFSCAHCDYSTTYKWVLFQHTLTHSRYLCTYCEKDYRHKVYLNEHIIRYHQDCIESVTAKIHSCPTCNYKTTIRYLLRKHMTKLHLTNGEKHSCTSCKQYFSDKDLLDDHIIENHQNLIHFTSSIVHSCSVCDYRTIRKDNIRIHRIRVHSENYLKYLCTYCDKNFKSNIILDEHVKSYHQNFIDSINSKVHNCSTCNYKTTIEDQLEDHMIRIHDKYLFTCCEKRFFYKKSLDDHIIEYHQDVINLMISKKFTVAQHAIIKQQ